MFFLTFILDDSTPLLNRQIWFPTTWEFSWYNNLTFWAYGIRAEITQKTKPIYSCHKWDLKFHQFTPGTFDSLLAGLIILRVLPVYGYSFELYANNFTDSTHKIKIFYQSNC